MLLICQSHLTTDNNLKIEKNVYYFENKHNVPYSTKKTLEVRVETNNKKLESNNYAGTLPWKVFIASQGH